MINRDSLDLLKRKGNYKQEKSTLPSRDKVLCKRIIIQHKETLC